MSPRASQDTCPVCSGVLRNTIGGCSACPMNSGCTMLCCENCGYATVAPESMTLNFFKRLFKRRIKDGSTPGTA